MAKAELSLSGKDGDCVTICEWKSCGEWLVVDMEDNHWFQNISNVPIICEFPLYDD